MRKQKELEARYREHVHAQEMFEKIERFLASTLSQTEFCHKENVAYWTFRYWLKQYRLREALARQAAPDENETTNEPPTDFIPLRIAPAAPSPACVLEFPSGVVMRFSGPVEPTVISQLIHTQQAKP